MTREARPTVGARYGVDGPWIVNLGPRSPFVADLSMAPPLTLADRYTATAIGDPPAILEVTVTDRETGATFRWSAEHADRMTLGLSSDETVANVRQLMQDGREILGLARRQTGGPARGSGVTVASLIAAAVELWNADPPPDGTPPTQADVAVRVSLEGRQLRRIAATAPGPGKPWERILTAAAISRRTIVSG